MTKAAIFDLDGTLLDSMGVWDQVDIDFLGKRGIEVPPDYMIKVSSMQFQQIAEYTIARFGLKDTPEGLMQEWDDMARVAYSTTVDDIVSVDDANDVGKDQPDVYLLAAERLGVKPVDCTVFEDLLVGIKSAKSVGMKVWAMHDDSSDADWPEICDIADGVLFDFHDAPCPL